MYSLTPYPITPIGNFIGVVLALLPLISQMRNLNLAVWGYALWIMSTNFIMFINTVVWHDNVKIVASVWCDIVTKLLIGTGVGTRACALIICVHLYRLVSFRRSLPVSSDCEKRSTRALIFELLLILGFPVFIMALYIIVQPLRFEIFEELGCTFSEYSYVGYIVFYAPVLITNLGSACLALLTLRAYFRLRREMPLSDSVFKSASEDTSDNSTNNKPAFKRLLVIVCLDTAFNLPVLILITIVSIVSGSNDSLNYPYLSWKNVHDGAGGNYPGLSLSSILVVPASEWSTNGWTIFNVKWNEWLYVAHAIMFFSVFGTTPKMRKHYSAALWFIPQKLGFSKRSQLEEEAVESSIAFSPNPCNGKGIRGDKFKRRSALWFLESGISAEHPSAPTLTVMTERNFKTISAVELRKDSADTEAGLSTNTSDDAHEVTKQYLGQDKA